LSKERGYKQPLRAVARAFILSNECVKQYSNNTSSHFTNRFYTPIDLSGGEYYVGLLGISFADTFKPKPVVTIEPPKAAVGRIARPSQIRPGTTPARATAAETSTTTEKETATTESSSYLGSLLAGMVPREIEDSPDDVIKIKSPPTLNPIQMVKLSMWTFYDFLSVLSRYFTVDDVCEMQQRYDGSSLIPRTTITVYDENYTIFLDSKISSFIGFGSKVEFTKGTYKSEVADPAKYGDVPDRTVSYIAESHPIKTVAFETPVFDENDVIDFYDQVTEQGVLSLEGSDIDASLSVSPLTNVFSVTFNSNPKQLQFSFPAFVNEKLGLHKDYFFSSDIHIKLPKQALVAIKEVTLTEDQIEREKILRDTVSQQVLVSTDFTESIRNGPNYKRVIRAIPRVPITSGVRDIEFKIQYYRVLPKELASISISLTDTNFSF